METQVTVESVKLMATGAGVEPETASDTTSDNLWEAITLRESQKYWSRTVLKFSQSCMFHSYSSFSALKPPVAQRQCDTLWTNLSHEAQDATRINAVKVEQNIFYCKKKNLHSRFKSNLNILKGNRRKRVFQNNVSYST